MKTTMTTVATSCAVDRWKSIIGNLTLGCDMAGGRAGRIYRPDDHSRRKDTRVVAGDSNKGAINLHLTAACGRWFMVWTSFTLANRTASSAARNWHPNCSLAGTHPCHHH